MEEKEPTSDENPSLVDSATVLRGQRPAGHIAPGSRVGHYTIREVLGEGGFAVVYLAEQTEPVRRRVALKVIKLGMDTKQVLARFEAERQALAMMNHPCVAKVFDAGVTDDGRSYFVMEHVPGVPITDHCDRQRLNIEQRLALFTQVCDAVQHAHQKGIIHRDIKPSNVLVSVKEGSAQVKVIDFGVAKALHQKLTERTLFTEQGQLIGTPEYMSPEQAEMTAQDIDTRTDIYSLGVLLYELLTGALPFDPKSLRKAAFAEIQKIIRQEEPPKPSTKLSSLGDASTTNADNRRLDTRSLMRVLRGDLDWIVMKALEKDRERRYETANGFASDIRRHLTHEPVFAGPPSTTYKLRKFVRRNRTGVLAGAFVAVALLAATGVSISFALSEAEQRRIAEAEAKRADTEEAVNDFLTDDLLAAVAPSAEKGEAKDVVVRLRQVLDVAAERIIEEASTPGGRFEDKPLIEASIRLTLTNTYWGLGEYEAAEPHAELAFELRRVELGQEHPDTLEAMNSLAVIYKYQGRYDEAEALYREALATLRRVLGDEDPLTLSAMNNLAVLLRSQGRLGEAEALHRESLAIRRRVMGDEDPFTLNSMTNLSVLLRTVGKLGDAELLAREALQTRRRVLGEDHPDTLQSMNSLAAVLASLGDLTEAEPLYQRTVEKARLVLGEQHLHTLIATNSLAQLYSDQGRYEEAVPLYASAVGGARGSLPERHWRTGAFLAGQGACLSKLKRYDDAEAALLEAHNILSIALGASHEETTKAIRCLIELYDDWGNRGDAAAWRTRLAVAESPTKPQSEDQCE